MEGPRQTQGSPLTGLDAFFGTLYPRLPPSLRLESRKDRSRLGLTTGPPHSGLRSQQTEVPEAEVSAD